MTSFHGMIPQGTAAAAVRHDIAATGLEPGDYTCVNCGGRATHTTVTGLRVETSKQEFLFLGAAVIFRCDDCDWYDTHLSFAEHFNDAYEEAKPDTKHHTFKDTKKDGWDDLLKYRKKRWDDLLKYLRN